MRDPRERERASRPILSCSQPDPPPNDPAVKWMRLAACKPCVSLDPSAEHLHSRGYMSLPATAQRSRVAAVIRSVRQPQPNPKSKRHRFEPVNRTSWRKRIRARIKVELASRGIEVHRARGVRRTLPRVLAHYRRLGLAPRTVIDVGVGPGTPELYASFPGSRLLLVEPLEEWRPDLERLKRERGAEVVLAAAGPETGEVEITVHRMAVCSSILGDRRGERHSGARRSVPLVRLDELVAARGLAGPYVVKVDVEGAELDVLRGALEVLSDCDLLLLEVSLFEFLPGTPQFHDVVAWIHDHGFVVADIYNGHNRLLDNALAQVDVAFVREHGRFRTNHAYATADQIDALYRSLER
jgi:FkbM family methyltransferase